MLVDGVNDGQGGGGHFREHPVDILREVPVLLAGEREVMEEHLEPLVGVVHAQVIKPRPAHAPGKFPVLEPRSVQDVDVGAALGRGRGGSGRGLEGAVEEEEEGAEGLFVQPQHKGIQGGGTVGGGIIRGRGKGAGVLLEGFLFSRPLGGVEEGGEAKGLSLGRVEDVLGQLLMMNSQASGSLLGSTRVQEPVVGTSLTCLEEVILSGVVQNTFWFFFFLCVVNFYFGNTVWQILK